MREYYNQYGAKVNINNDVKSPLRRRPRDRASDFLVLYSGNDNYSRYTLWVTPTDTEVAMRVLVVDDFATMRRIIKNALKQIDIDNVVEAGSGKDALSVLRDGGGADVIISDWMMPEMTGIEFLKACKADEAIREIPFVMVTAEAQKDSVREAVSSGVDHYIVKPFTPEKLREVIGKTLSKFGK